MVKGKAGHDDLVISRFVHLFAYVKLHKDTSTLRIKTHPAIKYPKPSNTADRTARENLPLTARYIVKSHLLKRNST